MAVKVPRMKISRGRKGIDSTIRRRKANSSVDVQEGEGRVFHQNVGCKIYLLVHRRASRCSNQLSQFLSPISNALASIDLFRDSSCVSVTVDLPNRRSVGV